MPIDSWKLRLLGSEFPRPSDLERRSIMHRAIRNRVIDRLGAQGGSFTIWDIMRDDFPSGYYALETYAPEYLSLFRDLIPDMEGAGWSVEIEEISDEADSVLSKTKVSVTPAPNP